MDFFIAIQFVHFSLLYLLTYFTCLQLNDDYYECLTKETTIALLEACKKGAPPKVGEFYRLSTLLLNIPVCTVVLLCMLRRACVPVLYVCFGSVMLWGVYGLCASCVS